MDLHAVPGGQNQDWHSDSGMSEALFWRFREFQDRAINLWVEIAKRYKGNPYVSPAKLPPIPSLLTEQMYIPC